VRVVSRVLDQDLRDIARIGSCQSLELSGNEFSQEGLRSLLALRDLKELKITSPQIDDNWLPVLSEFRGLQRLVLGNEQLSRQGHLKLCTDLPGVYVWFPEPQKIAPTFVTTQILRPRIRSHVTIPTLSSEVDPLGHFDEEQLQQLEMRLRTEIQLQFQQKLQELERSEQAPAHAPGSGIRLNKPDPEQDRAGIRPLGKPLDGRWPERSWIANINRR